MPGALLKGVQSALMLNKTLLAIRRNMNARALRSQRGKQYARSARGLCQANHVARKSGHANQAALDRYSMPTDRCQSEGQSRQERSGFRLATVARADARRRLA